MTTLGIVLALLTVLAAFAFLQAATTLSATISAAVKWTYTNVLAGGNVVSDNSFSYQKKLTNGTGAAGTADLIYQIKTTIAGAGSTTLDLAGALSDVFGNVLTFARVKFMYFNLTADTTATSVSIGNATAPLINWISSGTATVKVNNDGLLLIGDGGAGGYAVTATTADGLKVLNNDATNTATLKMAIVGSTGP